MPLSPLADAIYKILRPRVSGGNPEITYEDLVNRLPVLPPPFANVSARDVRLDQALGEIVTACRAKKLPALSAIVVRKDTKMPGAGYYPMAHPNAGTDTAKQAIEWGQEITKAKKTTYPQTL